MICENYFTLIFIVSTLIFSTFCDDFNTESDSSAAFKIFADLINTYKKELDECKISLLHTTTTEKPSYGSYGSYGFYKWEEMRPNYFLPDDVVYGGQNTEIQPLFVVRGKDSNYNYYGKLPMPYSNRNAYLTNEDREFATRDFLILTAKGYSWCGQNNVTSSANTINPICRARYLGLYIPGTLVGNSCRVGYGWKIHSLEDYEILIVGAGCA